MSEIISIEEWEHCKENILPVKSGRKASALSRAFGQVSTEDNQLENERKEFENRISKSNNLEDLSENEEDPLSIWLEYYEWAKESFPSSHTERLSVVQSATKIFRNTETYKQDERYLKLWVLYVSNFILVLPHAFGFILVSTYTCI